MIYSVVPEELGPELYDQLVAYYKDDPNVHVILDRRKTERRATAADDEAAEQRLLRDRRRARIPGEFPPLEAAG